MVLLIAKIWGFGSNYLQLLGWEREAALLRVTAQADLWLV